MLYSGGTETQAHTNATAEPPEQAHSKLGMVKLCAKILQIMHTPFQDYAQSFCQLCAPFSWLCATYFSYLKIKSLLN